MVARETPEISESSICENDALSLNPSGARPKHLHPPVSDVSDNYKAITILIQDKCATLKAF